MGNIQIEELQTVVIRIAGDSGDGIQLMGNEFTHSTALAQNDLGTFPDYPAEIRAPAGTLPGVSGFQIHFGSQEINTPGDMCDVLVCMNAAALKKNLGYLKRGGIIIANEDGFDAKNLRLAGYAEGTDVLGDPRLEPFQVVAIPITKLTRESLKDSPLGTKEADRSKNMFVLGLLCWLYNRELKPVEDYLDRKFSHKPDILKANMTALHSGWHFGETAELFTTRYTVRPADMPPGEYREITGNQAASLALLSASVKAGIQLFYGSYPITPASDILHELARMKHMEIITFQAEDEIAAISAAIGASYGGKLGVTASSGPGIDLKSEAMGLAVMLELPLVIIDVQRAGPSTGMPTKTEQADLLLALYGRHGEAPMPVLAAKSPSDCFDTVFEACRIAIEHMTPVFVLSDGYLANGAEPWRFPSEESLPSIKPGFATENAANGKYLPYVRDEKLVRKWALPGTPKLQNRIGGIEKEEPSGNISYDPRNHERMVKIRADKVAKLLEFLPKAQLDSGEESGDLLLLGWGSPYGAMRSAAAELRRQGYRVSHLHLRYLNPLPDYLAPLLEGFRHVVIPENNSGHLRMLLQAHYVRHFHGISKIQGLPFAVSELVEKARDIIDNQ